MKTRIALSAVLLAMAPFTASGAIVAATGQAVFIPAPASTLPGTLNPPGPFFFAFDEQQNANFSGLVDVLGPQLGFPNDFLNVSPTPASFTGVASHMIHSDPFGQFTTNMTGQVTFADPVVAIILDNNYLDMSDFSLGLPIPYPSGLPTRGLGTALTGNDTVTLLSPFTVEFTLGANIDQVRILTAVPTPGSAGLLALAAGAARRRRR